ncbi:uncharacterized protein [Ptychodera flava]|uniref:uncharacterized protein isoform X2 n=1 Tax=Ptychodera flava TaxID=63121 RepID=UPI00396A4672
MMTARTHTHTDASHQANSSDLKPGVIQNCTDFANIFKAFLGANFLAVPFDFMQSGVVLGVIGLTIIAALTDHCCQLIIKCKKEAVGRLHSVHHTPSSADLVADGDSGKEGELLTKSGEEMLEHYERTLTYGDLGKLCMGNVGVLLVEIALCITQLGFCVAYLIFLGTTIADFFPVQDGAVTNNGTGKNLMEWKVSGPVLELKNYEASEAYQDHLENGFEMDSELELYGQSHSATQNVSTGLAQIGIYPGQTSDHVIEYNLINLSNVTSEPVTDSVGNATDIVMTTDEAANSTGEQQPDSTAPPVPLLVLIPFPIFVLFAFVRNVRTFGPISVLANVALCIGFAAVFLFLVVDLEIQDSIVLFNWATFPVFWGHVTAAYEGIGLVIPVESSMKGNRPNFSAFLHVAILLLSLILGAFGILGYIHFGENVDQIITENLPSQNAVVLVVKVLLCVGIMFTYPIQMFPVIEIFEGLLFAPGKICGPEKRKATGADDEAASLLGSEGKGERPTEDPFKHFHVAVEIPDSVSAWKRNILRTILVIFTVGFAILFLDAFAYIIAFVGAIGSSLLVYILPCVFHLKLKWNYLSRRIIFKDIFVIAFCTVSGVVSLIVVI